MEILFPGNPDRMDPYKNFKFLIKDGQTGEYLAGLSKMSAAKRTTDVVEHRFGGDPNTIRKSPGLTKYEPITCERGVTQNTQFEEWANKVWNYSGGKGSETALKSFRKNLIVEIYNEAGQKALAYKFYRCWVSEYQPYSEFDAMGNAIAIQTLTIQHEGFERDLDVAEPTEPE